MSLLERVYYFHGELSRQRYPNTRTLMREFEISLPTARRDIAYLRDRLLAPLAYDEQRHGFFYTEEGFNLPFENSPRIVFLLGMLNRIAEESGLSDLPEIRQLEKRLAMLVAKDYEHIVDAIHCEWVEVEHPDPAIFDAIIDALVQRRQLAIMYRSPQKKVTSRTVEPHKLINYQGRWYLSAWCTLRQERRMFHLARIIKAELCLEKQMASVSSSADLTMSFGIFKGAPRYHAEILFTGTAAELVKNQLWHKNQKITETEDGIILRLPVRDDREIFMKVLQYGAHARVLKPHSLIEKVHSEIRKMTTIYD